MSLQGLVDYHLHTAVTVDAHMSEEEVCQRAIALGLQEIAFTNHVMLTQPDYTMSPEELVDHWGRVQLCQQHYPELTIRLGLEMDYYEGREDEVASTIQRYEGLNGSLSSFSSMARFLGDNSTAMKSPARPRLILCSAQAASGSATKAYRPIKAPAQRAFVA